MKPYWKIAMAAVAIGAGIWIGTIYSNIAIGAGTIQPGTPDDPVVTKSYVDQQIQKALGGGINTTPTKPSNPNNTTTPPKDNATTTTPKPTDKPVTTVVENTLTIVTVKPGVKLIAKAGAEFVVRNGKAVVYSDAENGVADLTAGKDIKNGEAVENNHLLSFPREGRGIMVQEGNTYSLTVMVRGGYMLQ
ncbi:hypothetical protein [Paenibacillus azoreducens]|uniref:Uncharacterized protein n=1 Tax=Paenibacillus azoreducens TaxID=116718 RepID=A0A920CTZ1_9BACL|nr:hypothetical protein [Paenibacillus azoreducens]GIO48882.1 hypothetical protein J34TS1_36470 [Paenibacillus azoreducens]